jgi:hypothetical protein
MDGGCDEENEVAGGCSLGKRSRGKWSMEASWE